MTALSLVPSSPAGISSTFFERAVPVTFRYRGHTGFVAKKGTAALKFAPSLAREAVFFDAEIGVPLALREAMGALHDVVVSDHRFKKRDRSAWLAYKARVASEEAEVRRGAAAAAEAALDDARSKPARAELAKEFAKSKKRYWKLRTDIEAKLRAEDPALFRMLVPCDPVVTVAPDAVMFEGFAKDESSYGCVVVDRNAFVGAAAADATLGTTNVDYSLSLAGEMQRLRSYRTTRFAIDPGGIEVETGNAPVHREEKIELPATWLRGFGQLSAALLLPARRVRLPAAALYAILAHLKIHRERSGPRALRFVLEPGKAPVVLVEPWGLRIEAHGPRYEGERSETIAVWGRRRLLSLARALPFAQLIDKDACVDVAFLGSGMPSVWTVDLGGARIVLALSGWTTNDWSGGARLDLLAAGGAVDEALTERVARQLQKERTRTVRELSEELKAPVEKIRTSTVRLAQLGQIVPDLVSGAVRYRSVIEAPLSAELIGDEPREIVEGKRIFTDKLVKIAKQDAMGPRKLVSASANGIACEAIFDGDGVMSKARCGCSHFHKFALKKGPCRHLLALRMFVTTSTQ